MFGFLFRKIFFAVLLALAVGVPYVLHTGDWESVETLLSKIPLDGLLPGEEDQSALELESLLETSARVAVDSPAESQAAKPTSLAVDSSKPNSALSGPEVGDLRTIFRFDMTPSWIMQHWSRVSVIEVDGMRGFRVPLVSGVQLGDLAGSMTYCFDEKDRLQRISFRGTTGDPRPLTTTVTQAFRLNAEFDEQPGLYLSRWNGRPTSYLKVENATILRADSPHTRYQVRLEVNRPRSYMAISKELEELTARLDDKGGWLW